MYTLSVYYPHLDEMGIYTMNARNAWVWFFTHVEAGRPVFVRDDKGNKAGWSPKNNFYFPIV